MKNKEWIAGFIAGFTSAFIGFLISIIFFLNKNIKMEFIKGDR